MGDSRGTTPSTAFRRKLYVPPQRRPKNDETFDDIPLAAIHAAAMEAMKTETGSRPNS